jgi:hypothetical protein
MKLDDLPKKNIYQVPDRYFDQLPGVVMARVREKEAANNPVTISTFWRQPLLRVALASLALVLTFFIIFSTNSNQSNSSQSNSSSGSEVLLSSVSEKDAVEYLMTSDRLETQDLTILALTDEDMSHEFIQVSQEEILQAVENEDLGEIYFY